MNKHLWLSMLLTISLGINNISAKSQPNAHNYALIAMALAQVFVKEQCNKAEKNHFTALLPSVIALGHMAHNGYVSDALKKLRWNSLKHDDRACGNFLQSTSTLLFTAATLYKVWEFAQPKPYRGQRTGSDGYDFGAPDATAGGCGSCCSR
jgi:hypothetical protein